MRKHGRVPTQRIGELSYLVLQPAKQDALNRPLFNLEQAFLFHVTRLGINLRRLAVLGLEDGRSGDKPSTCFEGPGPSQSHRGPRNVNTLNILL